LYGYSLPKDQDYGDSIIVDNASQIVDAIKNI
jgi:hypothetical protein